MGKLTVSCLDAINRDDAGSTLAEAGTIVFEGELHLMFARRQRRFRLDLWPCEVQQVMDILDQGVFRASFR